jgi:proteasome assembly chaperone 2
MDFVPTKSNLTFNSRPIILPIVSVGNVAQLSADLLILEFKLERVGILDARDLISVVGAMEDGSPGVTTPLELFGHEDFPLLVVQQRSPVLKSRKEEFIQSLVSFLTNTVKPEYVLVLSGVDLSNRTDAQMGSPTHFFAASNAASQSHQLSTTLPNLVPRYTSAPHSTAETPTDNIPFISGGGLTKRLVSSLSATSLPVFVLLEFVLEGDNREDAKILANAVVAVVGLKKDKASGWREPVSWHHGLFGTPQDQTLFG